MTPERLEEIEQILVDDGIYTCAVGELCDFIRAALDAQPRPCAHTDIYRVSHVSDQIVTMCQDCKQVLRVEECKGQEWVTVIDNRAVGAIPLPKPNCPKCGHPCERCSK